MTQPRITQKKVYVLNETSRLLTRLLISDITFLVLQKNKLFDWKFYVAHTYEQAKWSLYRDMIDKKRQKELMDTVLSPKNLC